MNQVSNPPVYVQVQVQQSLPNATASLVLGIISIVMCWCYGVIGFILGIIGLVLGNKAVALYKQSPGIYSEASLKNANAGRICSIIGLVLGALTLLATIVYLFIIGAAIGTLGWSNLFNL